MGSKVGGAPAPLVGAVPTPVMTSELIRLLKLGRYHIGYIIIKLNRSRGISLSLTIQQRFRLQAGLFRIRHVESCAKVSIYLQAFKNSYHLKRLAVIGGSSLAKLVGQKVILADCSCAITMKIGLLTRAPLGRGAISSPPPLVFLRYLPNQCRYHHQTCSTLSPNNFTHCVKILKSRVL